MENCRLTDLKTGSGRYMLASLAIFVYEFIGTACLVAIINASKGSPVAIGISLFFLLLLGGPISGAHYNPAVTIGVYINRIRDSLAAKPSTFTSLTFQAVSMICAQILGALFGMYGLFAVLKHVNETGTVDNQEAFPTLPTKEGVWVTPMFIECLTTCIFVCANLLVKDSDAAKHTAMVGEHNVNILGAAVIALSLTSVVTIAGPISGGSINPAVSISQTVLSQSLLGKEGFTEENVRIYLCGPIFGALIAGFFFWNHATVLREHTGFECEEEEEREILLK